MLAEKYFPQGSNRYQTLSNTFRKLDKFAALNPERWFGVWCMVLAGANVTHHIEDRWFYWDWSSFSYVLLVILAFATYWDKRFPVLTQKIDSVKSGLWMFLMGFILFLLGTIPKGFDYLVLTYGLPYLIYFIVGHLTYAIPIMINDVGEKSAPSKVKMAPMLSIVVFLTFLATVLGTYNNDPMISTCLLYTSPSPRDRQKSRMPSSA